MGGDARRSRRWWVAAVLAAVALVVWLSRGSDAAQIEALLDDVSGALTETRPDPDLSRQQRLKLVFSRTLAAQARVSAPDLPADGVGPEALAAVAEKAMIGFDSTRVSLGPPSIEVTSSGREASAHFQVVAAASGPNVGTVTDVREARVDLRRTDAGWQIVAVALTARSRDEPEARP